LSRPLAPRLSNWLRKSLSFHYARTLTPSSVRRRLSKKPSSLKMLFIQTWNLNQEIKIPATSRFFKKNHETILIIMTIITITITIIITMHDLIWPTCDKTTFVDSSLSFVNLYVFSPYFYHATYRQFFT